jgi:hypothetical protein
MQDFRDYLYFLSCEIAPRFCEKLLGPRVREDDPHWGVYSFFLFLPICQSITKKPFLFLVYGLESLTSFAYPLKVFFIQKGDFKWLVFLGLYLFVGC